MDFSGWSVFDPLLHDQILCVFQNRLCPTTTSSTWTRRECRNRQGMTPLPAERILSAFASEETEPLRQAETMPPTRSPGARTTRLGPDRTGRNSADVRAVFRFRQGEGFGKREAPRCFEDVNTYTTGPFSISEMAARVKWSGAKMHQAVLL